MQVVQGLKFKVQSSRFKVQEFKNLKIQKFKNSILKSSNHLIFKSSHHLIFKSTHHLIPFCFLLSAFCFLLSCNNPAPTGVIQNSATKTEETDPFIFGNKKIVELENEDIELFLKRYKWNMTTTETGLRYEIIKKGNGHKITIGETVTLEYSTLLLNGDEIYNSKDDGEKRFVVEKTEEIAGLHEAVQLMNRGSEARLIIPSHLAYGTAGDGNRIRQYQTIIMRVRIKN